jgi:hypothetical protein
LDEALAVSADELPVSDEASAVLDEASAISAEALAADRPILVKRRDNDCDGKKTQVTHQVTVF